MAHLNNLTNLYADALGSMFDEIPKSVLAAIAVSALTCGGDEIAFAAHRVAAEWQALYDNGIVAQRLGKLARAQSQGTPA